MTPVQRYVVLATMLGPALVVGVLWSVWAGLAAFVASAFLNALFGWIGVLVLPLQAFEAYGYFKNVLVALAVLAVAWAVHH